MAIDVRKVYPHVCGAAPSLMPCTTVSKGLSPRVWGSRAAGAEQMVQLGSIPTCVGQPYIEPGWGDMASVYPHVCGAAVIGLVVVPSNCGLSPRVWGSPGGHH